MTYINTLYRNARKHFIRNRIYVNYKDEQWEIDLVDLSEIAKENNGYKYILRDIDVFSKYLHAVPLKSKNQWKL